MSNTRLAKQYLPHILLLIKKWEIETLKHWSTNFVRESLKSIWLDVSSECVFNVLFGQLDLHEVNRDFHSETRCESVRTFLTRKHVHPFSSDVLTVHDVIVELRQALVGQFKTYESMSSMYIDTRAAASKSLRIVGTIRCYAVRVDCNWGWC